MLDLMGEIRRSAMMQLNRMGGLPNQRFFTPTDDFWRALGEVLPADVNLVDAGCGRGDLIGEAERYGMTIHGIDICARDGQDPRVAHADAVPYPWSPECWPMMCRPSHDGWTWDATRQARKSGAHVLYVGLPGNYKQDLGHMRAECLGEVGMEGEKLYLIKPYKQKGRPT